MLELTGHIDNQGKLSVYRHQELTDWRLKHTGKEVVLSLKVKRKYRSTNQNGYYWGCVVPMVRDAMNSYGNEFDSDTAHEFLKKEFNTKEVEVHEGHFVKVPVSTSDLDTAEFSAYIELIRRFAAEVLGIYIPNPNEQIPIEFQ